MTTVSILRNGEIVEVSAESLEITPHVPTPTDFPLRPDQFYAMLDIQGISTEAVEGAISSAIADTTQRKVALAKFRHTPVFYRDHPLFDALKATLGVNDAVIDTWWMQAKDF